MTSAPNKELLKQEINLYLANSKAAVLAAVGGHDVRVDRRRQGIARRVGQAASK